MMIFLSRPRPVNSDLLVFWAASYLLVERYRRAVPPLSAHTVPAFRTSQKLPDSPAPRFGGGDSVFEAASLLSDALFSSPPGKIFLWPLFKSYIVISPALPLFYECPWSSDSPRLPCLASFFSVMRALKPFMNLHLASFLSPFSLSP